MEKTEKTKDTSNENNDTVTIYKYKRPDWDHKYLAIDLLSTSYDWKLVTDKLSFGLYSFPFFSKTFCKELIVDLKKFNNWTNQRHRNYPTNDILLKEFSPELYNLYDSCIKNIIVPAANKLYDANFIKKNINHETFIVRYKPNVQASLKLHHDSSTFSVVTVISELDDYEGGGTYFYEHNVLVKNPAGYACIHPGKLTHKHGVRTITKGERYVIVSFCKDY